MTTTTIDDLKVLHRSGWIIQANRSSVDAPLWVTLEDPEFTCEPHLYRAIDPALGAKNWSAYECFVADQWSHRHNAAAAVTQGDMPDSLRQLFIMTAGLAGEAGEVVELLKKHVRDGKLDRDDLALELGDLMYYLTRVSQEFGFSLSDIQTRNVVKLVRRRARREVLGGAANG